MTKHLEEDEVKIEVLRLIHDGYSLRETSDYTGISKTSISDFINKKTYKDWWSTITKPIAKGDIHDHHSDIKKANGRRFILTSAQNNTYVHTKFLQSLENCAKHLKAQIIVGTFSYNLYAFQNLAKGEADWFDPKIKDYIVDEPILLASDLLWCGELNILPTAVNPLSGLHSYAKGKSSIIPHVKVQMESVPTHKSTSTRMMYTTGAVTKRNYIQKKSGQKASFHHVFGALLVEIDDEGDWFVRQLIANSQTGEFQDLDVLYTPNGVYENQKVEAINWGDIHVEKLDVLAASASFFNEDSMLNVLKPKYQLVHDVLDMEARNHHSINDPYFRFIMNRENKEEVWLNVLSVARFLESIASEDSKVVVVESNHDLALKKWLKEADYKTDPINAIFFLRSQLAIYEAMDKGHYGLSILEYWVNQITGLENIKFLKTDESFKICASDDGGIECGCHGDKGANGSRGSSNSFTKFESKYNLGHSHTASIKDGVYTAGVLGRLDMGYNVGHNSWSHSNIITYPNGKRTIVTIKNGKWRAV